VRRQHPPLSLFFVVSTDHFVTLAPGFIRGRVSPVVVKPGIQQQPGFIQLRHIGVDVVQRQGDGLPEVKLTLLHLTGPKQGGNVVNAIQNAINGNFPFIPLATTDEPVQSRYWR